MVFSGMLRLVAIMKQLEKCVGFEIWFFSCESPEDSDVEVEAAFRLEQSDIEAWHDALRVNFEEKSF